ncbi:uncharacterized protein LOC100206094 isoform X1 [Hydra vulgaris]|uniref:uncharacterized protein LOC100206094 isoform X1 n=1 Tax=Hydra vulgaris TaxID=6087 RepID=UPI001F5E92BA|nr:uncharacterized protein LOC100206094 [Hydra vulgaris]XP_012553663.2 uncharacterized protein LOC100206094 [Hydra vulgaris]XP_012553664.2 uncharacterized protein LOC100206094 [Hydra vulgaris]
MVDKTIPSDIDRPDIRRFQGNQFIQISVRHARTHIDEGKAQFTDYEVEIRTNHIAFTIKYSKVRRRYSDFVWLRSRLIKDTQTEAPRLPGKRLFGRFHKDFIKQRQKQLKDFIFGLVENASYLSHPGFHLFFQSSLSVDDIEEFLDNNKDGDASEEILAESECRDRLNGVLLRERAAKHDSGFSGEEPDWLNDNFENNTNDQILNLKIVDDDICNDDHFADDESDDNDDDSIEPIDKNDIILNQLRLNTLPAPIPTDDEKGFESSVEYLYCSSLDSGNTKKTKVTSVARDRSQTTPRKKRVKKMSFRERMANSNPSLTESQQQDRNSDTATSSNHALTQSQSFYEDCSDNVFMLSQKSPLSSPSKTRKSSSLKFPKQNTPLRRSCTFLSSTEKTPVKRKISLNEYIIVHSDTVREVNKQQSL